MFRFLLLHDRIFACFVALCGQSFLSILARLTFTATLLIYFWNSALTKIGEGITGLFVLDSNAYVQIFPKQMENIGYDASQLSFFLKVIAILGTWAEFILPLLILLGLFSRLAAVGMIIFIMVQSVVDIFGHGVSFGAWFDRQSSDIIADQRLFWILLFMVIIIKGGGKLSLDNLFKRY